MLTPNENGTATFTFTAYIERSNGLYQKYLSDGAADNDMVIAIRGAWTSDTGHITQNFVYLDSMVQKVVNSENYSLAYVCEFSGYAEYMQYGNISFTATFQSGTGVIAAGETLIVSQATE